MCSGLREADIALTEIANGKLTFESTFGQDGDCRGCRPGRAVPQCHRRQESGGEEKSGVIRLYLGSLPLRSTATLAA